MKTHPTYRSGAALILALIILAALILLGIPFLMSQSVSLSGSQTFRARLAASNARDSAESLGYVTASEALALQFSDTSRNDTTLAADLGTASGGTAIFDVTRPDRVVLDLQTIPAAAGIADRVAGGDDTVTTRCSLTIADDSARLEVNDLDVTAWARLLKEVGIRDWDDDLIEDSDDPIPDESGDTSAPPDGDDDDDGLDGPNNGDNDDNNDHGELAEALAALRFRPTIGPDPNPYGRITDLEQLLYADPGHNTQDPAVSSYDYGTAPGTVSGFSYGFRTPLTRHELELLRPHLTLHGASQGSGGLLDVGNIVHLHSSINDAAIDVAPTALIADGASLQTRTDTGVIRRHRVTGRDDTDLGRRVPIWDRGLDGAYHYQDTAGGGQRPIRTTTVHGDPVLVEVPASVNVLSMTATVAEVVLGQGHNVNLDADLAGVATWPQTIDIAGTNHFGGQPGFKDVTNMFQLVSPAATGYWTPPVDLRSWGVVRTHAGATAVDPKGRPIASAERGMIAQTLPAGTRLKVRWDTQAEHELIRRSGFASRMTSWPKASNRVANERPDGAAGDSYLLADVMPNLATIEDAPVPRMWSRPMAKPPGTTLTYADTDEMLTDGIDPESPINSGVDVRPDGLEVLDKLSYRISAADGPFRPVGGSALHEVDGNHVSMWICPTDPWTATTPLIDIRAKDANTFREIGSATASGDTDHQNLWRLHYEPSPTSGGYLVVTLANPAIEHTSNLAHDPANHPAGAPHRDGLQVPDDDITDPTIYLNEQTLGHDPAAPFLAPAVPERWGTSSKHVYYLPDGLEVDRWYHVQVIVSHDRPGGQCILVDGYAGRDLNALTAAALAAGDPPPATLEFGDHLTLPSALLATELVGSDDPIADLAARDTGDLLSVAQPGDVGSDPTVIATRLQVELATTPIHDNLGITAEDLFPQRGTLLIDNEYISYTAISGNTLSGCYRSLRANTHTDSNYSGDPGGVTRWPFLQAHNPGDLVVPGGYRLRLGSGLFTGAATLRDALGDGDPSNGYRLWCNASVDPDDWEDDNPDHVQDQGGGVTRIFIGQDSVETGGNANMTIPFTDSFPAGQPLPPSGVIIIRAGGGRAAFHYTGIVDSAFTGLTLLDELNPATGIQGFSVEDGEYAYFDVTSSTADDAGPEIWISSIALNPVTGDTPDTIALDDTQWAQEIPHTFDDGSRGYIHTGEQQVQVEAADGRIEWIQYDAILNLSGQAYLINRSGFSASSRGRERTAFAPYVTPTPSVAFAAGNRVLPVQTSRLGGNNRRHFIATGDVVTIMPTVVTPGDPATHPLQAVIRFAATDGYAIDKANIDTNAPKVHPSQTEDTRNEWFTFTERIPPDRAPALAGGFELLSGLCWSGNDLSTLNPVGTVRNGNPSGGLVKGCMPRFSAFTDEYRPDGTNAEVYFLSDGRSATAAALAAIDGFTAGPLQGAAAGTIASSQVESFDSTLSMDEDDLPVVTVDSPIFYRQNTYGLCLINGEVMAYARESDTQARIIARGLLGSQRSAHAVREMTHRAYDWVYDESATPPSQWTLTEPVYTEGPAALWLPVGPVTRLHDALPASMPATNSRVRLRDGGGTTMNAMRHVPAVLLVSAGAEDPSYEMALLGYENGTYFTTDWMRGAYGSEAQDFAVDDLVIGWWPRYPSGLPPAPSAQHFRCRAYAWAGFPLRFYDTIMTDDEAAKVAVTDASGLFTIQARAMAPEASTDRDWTLMSAVTLAGDGSEDDIGGLLYPSGSAFDGPVDGSELRISWTYNSSTTNLSEMVRRTGISPRIESVELGAYSRIKILGRDGDR